MEFFKELRDAAYKIDKGISEVNHLSEPNRKQDDLTTKTAIVLLRDKKKEMLKLKTEASKLLKAVRGKVPFVELLNTCEQLIQKNNDILEKTETHLQQYGYERPKKKETIDNKQDTSPVGGEEGTHIDEDENLDNLTEQPSTPECLAKPSADLSRTPKLADFGLSERSMKIMTENRSFKNSSITPAQQDDGFKVPAPPLLSSKGQRSEVHSPARSKPWLHGEAEVPEAFRHDGVLVTPGIMSGMGKEWTPMPSLDDREKTQYGTSPMMKCSGISGQTSPQWNVPHKPSFRSDSSDEAQSPDLSKSPIPPILCTPGVKQIQKPNSRVIKEIDGENHTPEPPTFLTPSLKNLQKTCVEEDDNNDTPEPPVLMTPGLRQLNMNTASHKLDQMPEAPKMMRDFTDTPEAPELTCSYRFLITDSDGNTTEKPQNVSQKTEQNIQDKLPASDACSLSRWPVLQSLDNVSDTPEPPELTMSYKYIAPSQNVAAPPALSVGDDDFPSPIKPKLTGHTKTTTDNCSGLKMPSSLGEKFPSSNMPQTPQLLTSQAKLDFGTPQMPELTGTYNFASLSSTNDSEQSEDKENVKPKEKNKVQISNKMGTSKSDFLSSGLVKPSFPEEVALCVYVPLLTSDEYANQPDYMQRILGHDKLNKAIKKLNKILGGKIQAGSEASVCDLDLQNDLESNESRVFFLCLMRLGRLSLQHAHGKKYYTPT